jgi:hypothetical protein
MHVEMMPFGVVFPYPRNTGKITDAAVDKTRSHPGVPLAAADRGRLETDAGADQAYRLADNRTHEETNWESKLAELPSMAVDLSATAFSHSDRGVVPSSTAGRPLTVPPGRPAALPGDNSAITIQGDRKNLFGVFPARLVAAA